MAWQLVEEVLDGCPDLKYREFRILIALAASARYETRQGWPGFAKLALQGNCSMRTVGRAITSLQARGIVKQVERQAPGRRGVYEILPLTADSMVSAEQATNPGQQATP
jgi:DNA-binding MarR family transcriptional regulator